MRLQFERRKKGPQMNDGPWKVEYHVECDGETDYFDEEKRDEAVAKAKALKAEFPDAKVSVLKASYFSTEYKEIWPDDETEE